MSQFAYPTSTRTTTVWIDRIMTKTPDVGNTRVTIPGRRNPCSHELSCFNNPHGLFASDPLWLREYHALVQQRIQSGSGVRTPCFSGQ